MSVLNSPPEGFLFVQSSEQTCIELFGLHVVIFVATSTSKTTTGSNVIFLSKSYPIIHWLLGKFYNHVEQF